MDVLRDHYEGTAYDLTKGMAAGPFGSPNRGPVPPRGSMGLWERAISMHRGSWSYVLEARPAGRSITWLGLDSAHGTAYMPFFGAAARGAPESFHSHEGCMSKFSTKVAWWAFNMVNQYTDINFGLINKDVRERAREIEDEGEKQVQAWFAEADMAGVAPGHYGELAAAELLTARSNAFAEAKVADWWSFAFSLFAKFGRYTVTHNESANGEVLQRYPEWWIASPEVGYTLWAPQGPYHGVLASAVQTPNATKTALAAIGVGSAGLPPPVLPVFAAAATLVGLMGYKLGVHRGQARLEDVYLPQP